jgi:hypothetical protein
MVEAVKAHWKRGGGSSAVMFLMALMSSGGGRQWRPKPRASGRREGVICIGRMDGKLGKGGAHRRAAMAAALRLRPNLAGSAELR